MYVAGGAVLSHRVAPAVPSAQRGLTSEFGMGSGVSPALVPPAVCVWVEMGDEGVCVPWSIDALLCVRYFSWTGQASRALSTARLHASQRVHLPPINAVVFCGPSEGRNPGRIHLGRGFP